MYQGTKTGTREEKKSLTKSYLNEIEEISQEIEDETNEMDHYLREEDIIMQNYIDNIIEFQKNNNDRGFVRCCYLLACMLGALFIMICIGAILSLIIYYVK